MGSSKALALITQQIKEARIKQNLSVKKLSEISGVSVYKIKKIESGNYNFKLEDFNKLTKSLNGRLVIKKSPLE